MIQCLLKRYSFANIRWLYKQANHESGYLTSRLYNENNNIFGMSCVRKRPTTQVGCVDLSDGNTNGIYTSNWSCVKDRLMWDVEFNISPRSEDYANLVSARFHPLGQTYRARVDATGDEGYSEDLLVTALLPIAPITLLSIAFFT